MRFTGQAGTEAYNATVEAAKAAKPTAVTQRNQEYLTGNEIGQSNVQSARATAQELEVPGASIAADIEDLAKRSEQLLSEKGVGQWYLSPFTADTSRYHHFAWGKGRRISQQQAALALREWRQFVGGMSPKLRVAIGERYIPDFDAFMQRAYNNVVRSGSPWGQEAAATRMTQAYGAFQNRASEIARSVGEQMPPLDIPIGPELAVTRLKSPTLALPFVSPGMTPQTRDEAMDANVNDPLGQTPSALPSVPAVPQKPAPAASSPPPPGTPVGPPQVSAGQPPSSVTNVTYDYSVGNHFGPELPGRFDLPGRLEPVMHFIRTIFSA